MGESGVNQNVFGNQSDGIETIRDFGCNQKVSRPTDNIAEKLSELHCKIPSIYRDFIFSNQYVGLLVEMEQLTTSDAATLINRLTKISIQKTSVLDKYVTFMH